MRICTRLSDNRIIESQSNDNASLETLKANATSAGYAPHEVTVSVIPDADFRQLMSAQTASDIASAPKVVDQKTDKMIAALIEVGVISSKQADALRASLLK